MLEHKGRKNPLLKSTLADSIALPLDRAPVAAAKPNIGAFWITPASSG